MAKRSTRISRVMKPAAENQDAATTPGGGSSPIRDGAKRRHVSLQEAAALLDRDRNTVKKWLEKEGCPYVQRADRDLGQAWVLDIADIVRWLEKRAADAAADKMSLDGEGRTSEDEAKRRRAVVQAIMAEIELAELLQAVVRISLVTDRVAADYAELRARLLGVPDAVAGHFPAFAAEVKDKVDAQIRTALRALRQDRKLKEDLDSEE